MKNIPQDETRLDTKDVWIDELQQQIEQLETENKRFREYIKKIVDGYYFDPVIGISLSAVGDAQKALEDR